MVPTGGSYMIADTFHSVLHAVPAFRSFISSADLIVIEKIFIPYIYR
jgi:hypothetical protein